VARTEQRINARQGSAREAIRQTKPFRSPGHEALINLLLTTDAVRFATGSFLAESTDGELTQAQYNALRILRGAGKDGLPTLEIAERMMERTPGVTRMIDRLETKGLVERRRSTEDRRQVFCRITKQGEALMKRLDPLVDAHDERLFAALTKQETRELIRLLDKVRNRLARGA
jgi:DNA-binding MarR family transcriptional regulator